MNLYKIKFSHTAPKDQKIGIVTYLFAENDEQVYNHIDSEYNNTCWGDYEDDKESFEIYDDDYDVIGTELFKEKMLRIKGQMNDEDYSYDDAYYGITLYGWELMDTDIDEDKYSEPIRLGMISNIKINNSAE